MRPVLLVDVDGPLNPYAAKPHRRPEGYQTHRLLTPRWEAAERRRLTEWGLPNKPVKPLRVWLSPDHGPALEALPFDLVWATTWEEEANADSLRRSTIGWRTGMTEDEAWEAGRGIWKFNADRALAQDEVQIINTAGVVLAVATITGISKHHGRYALEGELRRGDTRGRDTHHHPSPVP